MRHVPIRRALPRRKSEGDVATSPLDAPEETAEERLERARIRAQSENTDTTVSAQVPRFLKLYIDQYAARTGTTKQRILIESLCLFIAANRLPPEKDLHLD
ncbi:MAG: hypothetical protein EOP06_16400 [Proteobacteria bacterium]|nr:MAG: hypothetical protein EOP06_16400 [Pseudomonadota bacterium]